MLVPMRLMVLAAWGSSFRDLLWRQNICMEMELGQMYFTAPSLEGISGLVVSIQLSSRKAYFKATSEILNVQVAKKRSYFAELLSSINVIHSGKLAPFFSTLLNEAVFITAIVVLHTFSDLPSTSYHVICVKCTNAAVPDNSKSPSWSVEIL